MIGFFGSDVGPGAISDPTNDCPRQHCLETAPEDKLATSESWLSSKIILVKRLYQRSSV